MPRSYSLPVRDRLRDSAFAARLAERGLAVLTYDKRGVGKSAGFYEDENNVSATNLELLAADAQAALAVFRADIRWRSVPHGYVGYSQAGWVLPMALARDPSPPAFFVLLSGPMCTTSEQLHFQRFAESRAYDPARWTEDDIQREMRGVRVRTDDVDPAAFLRDSAVPGLWLFGGRDVYVPVQLSIQRIRELDGRSPAQLAYRVYAGSGHDLTDARERDAFEDLVEFIAQRAGAGSR